MNKARIFLILSVLFIRSLPSFSCGNEYFYQPLEMPVTKNKINLQHLFFVDVGSGMLPYWYQGFGENVSVRHYELIKKISSHIGVKKTDELTWPELQKALNQNVDHKLLSDFAWYELRVGSKQKAVALLEALYAKYPNKYNVLANLGTAYEVTGQNTKALSLLKKAVTVNPSSHYGSEWIHINILEQKVSGNNDYKQILNLGADNDFSQWIKGNVYNKGIKPDSLMKQIAYQLHERISFVPDPDPIVGQLIFDFADLAAITYSISEAKPFYRYAVTYDSSLAKKTKERLLIGEGEATAAETIIDSTSVIDRPIKMPASDTTQWILIAVVAIIIGASAIYLISRKKNKTSV